MIIGGVRGAEVFKVPEAVRHLKADPEVSAADQLDVFFEHATRVLGERYPSASEGFVAFVTAKAWSEHEARGARLVVPASELALMAQLLLTADPSPARDELAARVAGAQRRLGVAVTPRLEESSK